MKIITGWWGTPYDSVSSVNERALVVIEKSGGQFALEGSPLATPHQALVYEVRVKQGYGMRLSQDRSVLESRKATSKILPRTFRGFLEQMLENGHKIGRKHGI